MHLLSIAIMGQARPSTLMGLLRPSTLVSRLKPSNLMSLLGRNTAIPSPSPSALMRLPFEVREKIIVYAFSTGDELPGVGPVIRIEGMPTAPSRYSVANGIVYTLKWTPESSAETCLLARVNRQLNKEVELIVFSKFLFLFASGLNTPSIKAFVNSLSSNAKSHLHHFVVYFDIPIGATDFLLTGGMSNSLYSKLYREMQPSGLFSILWNSLPCVKKINILIGATRTGPNPSGDEWLYHHKLARDIWTFLIAFQMDRMREHRHVPPVFVNILNTPDGLEDLIPRFNDIEMQTVELEGNVSSIQIEI